MWDLNVIQPNLSGRTPSGKTIYQSENVCLVSTIGFHANGTCLERPFFHDTKDGRSRQVIQVAFMEVHLSRWTGVYYYLYWKTPCWLIPHFPQTEVVFIERFSSSWALTWKRSDTCVVVTSEVLGLHSHKSVGTIKPSLSRPPLRLHKIHGCLNMNSSRFHRIHLTLPTEKLDWL